MKLNPFRKYKVVLLDISPSFSNKKLCNCLFKFLEKCKNDKVYVTSIVIEASEIPYAIIVTPEEIELDNTYNITEETRVI